MTDVLRLKTSFYHCAWASYDTAVPGTLKILPPDHNRATLAADYAKAMLRYQELLKKPESVRVSTIESLLGADVLPASAAAAFKERYLW